MLKGLVFYGIMATETMLAADDGENAVFISKSLGVSMEVPVVAEKTEGNYHVATFLLPPKDGFTANVSVIRQKFDGDILTYDRLEHVHTIESIVMENKINPASIISNLS